MANKVRLGFIGANVKSHWASESHFPALRAHPDIEMTAVCTTNPASAEQARKVFGAKLAFSDYREMVVSHEIDAVAVVVKVPSHYGPTRAAIEAGKHVYTEWPLGLDTAEAVELATLARAKGVRTAIGLQSRVVPALLYMKELIATGYVGQVLDYNVITVRPASRERPSTLTWGADVAMGANPLTIAAAHSIDALRFVAGDFVSLGGMVTTQIKQWHETDTKRWVDVTAPDTVLLHGLLAGGAVASVHVTYMPWATSGYRMEVYGTEGTLIASAKTSSNRDVLRLQGAQRSQKLQDIEVPEGKFTQLPEDFPRGTPFNVGQMYSLFAQAVRTGKTPDRLPTFDTAVEMHHLLDHIRHVSETRGPLPVAALNARA